MINLREIPTEGELDELATAVEIEQERRRDLLTVPAQIPAMAARYRAAAGMAPGDPWVQPEGAHDAYPAGWTVTHNGVTWEAVAGNTMTEPGVAGWTEGSTT